MRGAVYAGWTERVSSRRSRAASLRARHRRCANPRAPCRSCGRPLAARARPSVSSSTSTSVLREPLDEAARQAGPVRDRVARNRRGRREHAQRRLLGAARDRASPRRRSCRRVSRTTYVTPASTHLRRTASVTALCEPWTCCSLQHLARAAELAPDQIGGEQVAARRLAIDVRDRFAAQIGERDERRVGAHDDRRLVRRPAVALGERDDADAALGGAHERHRRHPCEVDLAFADRIDERLVVADDDRRAPRDRIAS